MKNFSPIFLVLLIGCQSVPEPIRVIDPTSVLMEPVTAAERDLALGNYGQVRIDLENVGKAAKLVSVQSVGYQGELRKVEISLKRETDLYDSSWFGGKTHRLIRWIIGVTFLVGLVGGGSMLLFGNPVLVNGSAHALWVMLTGGFHLVLLAIRWFLRRFRKSPTATNPSVGAVAPSTVQV